MNLSKFLNEFYGIEYSKPLLLLRMYLEKESVKADFSSGDTFQTSISDIKFVESALSLRPFSNIVNIKYHFYICEKGSDYDLEKSGDANVDFKDFTLKKDLKNFTIYCKEV